MSLTILGMLGIIGLIVSVVWYFGSALGDSPSGYILSQITAIASLCAILMALTIPFWYAICIAIGIIGVAYFMFWRRG